MRRLALLVVAVAASACSHTYFQYAPAVPERDQIARTTAAIVAAADAHDVGAVAARLDPEGRKASLLAVHDLVGKKSDAVKLLDGFVMAVLFMGAWDIAFGGNGESAVDLWTKGAPFVKDQIEKAVGQSLFGGGASSGTGLAPNIVDELAGGPEERRAKLAPKLVADEPPGCTFDRVIVSYRASILDHVDWDWAATSRTFAKWRRDVRGIHLVKLACGDRVGLWLMDAYETGDPLLVGWHYFTTDEWAKVEPKLTTKLELDR